MRMIRTSLATLVVTALAVGASWAQTTATSGSINGTAADETGAVLPGVTVTATSPAMQGQQVVYTDGEGNYRLPGVPPGAYRIVFELPGFTTFIREGVQVGLGFTATIDAELRVATLEETVTVTGESPVVDVASTTTATNFDASKLSQLPGARDFWSILANSPSVQMERIDVGGSRAGTQTPYRAYDTKATQHRPMVEGMVMTEGQGGALFYYDFGSMDEVAIGTGTHSADMGWPGVQSQFIAKSGGNEFHGSFKGDNQYQDLQGTNIDDEQIALGVAGGPTLDVHDVNRMFSYYDVNADVGGFIAKDKLWFYGSGRDQDVKVRLANFPVIPFETRLSNYSAKATYSLNQSNKFVAYTMAGRKNQLNRLNTWRIGATSAFHTSTDSTWNQLYWGLVHKGEWNSVINDRTFFEVRAGKIGYDWPNESYAPDSPAIQDTGSLEVFGGNENGWQLDISRWQLLSSVTYYVDDMAGSHNFKFGGEFFREIRRNWRGNNKPSAFAGDVLHEYSNGVPIVVYLLETASVNDSRLQTTSFYTSDSWAPNDHLTLNLGVRYDRYYNYLPENTHDLGRFFQWSVAEGCPCSFAAEDVRTWNQIAPRLGATYDVTADGKTVIKANYAIYYWNPSSTLAQGVNSNPDDWYQRWNWTDTSGDGLWQPGEETQLTRTSGGTAGTAIDPGINDTKTTEVAMWVERELIPNFGVRGGVVYREIDDFWQTNRRDRPFDAYDQPIAVQDPGPNGVVGDGDDGGIIQAFNLNPANLALRSVDLTSNLPGVAKFTTFEISGTKRMADNWSLITGFSYAWNRDQEDQYFGNDVRQDFIAENPNEAINTSADRSYDFTTWTFKVNGTFNAPYGIIFSPNVRHQSGQPFGRLIRAPLNYGTQTILVEPIDSNRQDNITVIDLRVQKEFALGGARRLSGVFDLYNIFNTNAAENINWTSSSTYLRPSVILSPRVARFGVKFEF